MDAREMGSGFSNGEWLCCSLFALIAHSSPENLLTCHLIYHQNPSISSWQKAKKMAPPTPNWKLPDGSVGSAITVGLSGR